MLECLQSIDEFLKTCHFRLWTTSCWAWHLFCAKRAVNNEVARSASKYLKSSFEHDEIVIFTSPTKTSHPRPVSVNVPFHYCVQWVS